MTFLKFHKYFALFLSSLCFFTTNAQAIRENYAINYYSFSNEKDSLLNETHNFLFDLKGNEIIMIVLSKKDTIIKSLSFYDNFSRKIRHEEFRLNRFGKLMNRIDEYSKYDSLNNLIEFSRIPIVKEEYLNPYHSISEKYKYNSKKNIVYKSSCNENSFLKNCKNDSLIYNKNDLLIEEISSDSKTTYEYDSSRNKKIELYYGHNFIKSAKTEYTYNKDSQKMSVTMYDYSQINNSWKERIKDEYKYDQLGNLSYELNSAWDYELNIWRAKFKKEFIYNAQNKIINSVSYNIDWSKEGIVWKVFEKGYYVDLK